MLTEIFPTGILTDVSIPSTTRIQRETTTQGVKESEETEKYVLKEKELHKQTLMIQRRVTDMRKSSKYGHKDGHHTRKRMHELRISAKNMQRIYKKVSNKCHRADKYSN